MDVNSILMPVLSIGGMGVLFGLGLGFAALTAVLVTETV